MDIPIGHFRVLTLLFAFLGTDDLTGDSEEFLVVNYEALYDRIFNYLFRHVFHRETAEDLASNTFLKAYRFLKGKPDIANMNAWLYKIATNEILMHVRSSKKRPQLSLDDEKYRLGEMVGDQEKDGVSRFVEFMHLRQSLERLQNIERLIVELYYFEDRTHAQIGEILGLKEVTVRSRLRRSLKKLKAMMTE